jgi:hypothetical protein
MCSSNSRNLEFYINKYGEEEGIRKYNQKKNNSKGMNTKD